MCLERLTNKPTHKLTISSNDSSSNPVSDFHCYELPTTLNIIRSRNSAFLWKPNLALACSRVHVFTWSHHWQIQPV